ncbi:MAG: hypothetical protein IKA02_03360 [Clostridia bacterium]|nr:hypothetical protein [Clostridia bacterium]
MSSVGKQIEDLLSAKKPSAPDMTNPLKEIGDGNMHKGISEVFKYGKGTINGIFICSGAIGVLYAGYKGFQFIRKKLKEHKERGEKILKAFNEETNEIKNETE